MAVFIVLMYHRSAHRYHSHSMQELHTHMSISRRRVVLPGEGCEAEISPRNNSKCKHRYAQNPQRWKTHHQLIASHYSNPPRLRRLLRMQLHMALHRCRNGPFLPPRQLQFSHSSQWRRSKPPLSPLTLRSPLPLPHQRFPRRRSPCCNKKNASLLQQLASLGFLLEEQTAEIKSLQAPLSTLEQKLGQSLTAYLLFPRSHPPHRTWTLNRRTGS
ncbi:hypothetical protein HPB51_027042 [Rhipicephalus microplus]|uniref:Uncharacterized protein n=1 Tax=Rhipicephalus microplus TaxID=6941 RepID=A0A9J6D0W8_RHIMP|nr:hypothetical protein HPB51_027042 [Rhipicephalus microplus]